MYDANWASVPSGRAAASPCTSSDLPWGVGFREFLIRGSIHHNYVFGVRII